MAEPNRVLARQVSPELSMEVKLEQEISKHGSNQAITNKTQKLIEQKEKELRESIMANYQRIKGVEQELAGLTLQLQVNVGPRKHALELLRNKIERQNEKVSRVRSKYDAAKKVLDALAEELAREEEAKEQLCSELGLLVQQSATAQLAKLEELKNHLEQLNGGVQPSCASPATSFQHNQPAAQPSVPEPVSAVQPVPQSSQGPEATNATHLDASGRSRSDSQGGGGRVGGISAHAPAAGVYHAAANGSTAAQAVQGPGCSGLTNGQADRHDDRDRRLLEEVKAARAKAANGSRSNSPANSADGVASVATRRAPAGATLFAPSQQPRMQLQAAAAGNGRAGKFSGFDV